MTSDYITHMIRMGESVKISKVLNFRNCCILHNLLTVHTVTVTFIKIIKLIPFFENPQFRSISFIPLHQHDEYFSHSDPTEFCRKLVISLQFQFTCCLMQYGT